MKKLSIFFSAALTISLCANLNSYAQNQVTISGNTCAGNILTAKLNGAAVEKIQWKLNGVIIATSGSPRNAVTVAGGNGPGSAANQLYYPNGVFVDKDKNIWVADASNGRVQKFAPGSKNGVTIGGNLPNRPTFPVNIFVSEDGAVYAADYFEGKVKRLAKDGTRWVTVAGQNNELDLVRGVWVDKHGNVYCTQYGFYFNGTVKLDGMILKYPLNSSVWQIVAGGNGVGSALNQFSIPGSVMLDDEGNIYVADSQNDHGLDNARVMKWAPGATEGVIVAGGNGVGNKNNQCPYPFHAFVDKNKNVYVSNYFDYHKITKWAPGAAKSRIVAGGNGAGDDRDQLNGPGGIFLDGKDLYVVDIYNHRVQKFDLNNNNCNKEFAARHPGTYTAVATFEDGTVVESNSITITACNEAVTATNNALTTKESKVNETVVYPNPVKDILHIRLSGKAIITITSQSGKTLLTQHIENTGSINIAHLPAGIYYVKNNATGMVQKLVISQ